MMLNLFGEQYSQEIKKANWEYYEPRTEHGSSLSYCAYALVAADIGKTDWAYKYFLQTAKLDLEAKYKVWVGTIFMGGSHPGANGGAWMAAIRGFAGLKADAEKININPNLYKKWNALSFDIFHRQDRFSVRITADKVMVKASGSNKKDHLLNIRGKEYICAPGKEVEVNYHSVNSNKPYIYDQ